MFRRIFSSALQTAKNNSISRNCFLLFAGSQLIAGTVGLPIYAISFGDTTPILHRKRLLLESEEMELQVTNNLINDLKKSANLYHSPEIDVSLNHIVNAGVPKLLNSYKKEVGDEKFESLKKFVEKLKWEVFVIEDGGPIANSRMGKTVVGDSCLHEFSKEAMNFFLCREVGRSLCKHENEMTTYLSFATADLILAACIAFSLMSRMAALKFFVAGGVAVLVFDLYNGWRLADEADCVGLVLYGFCGWHPDTGPDSEMFMQHFPWTENALEWFKTFFPFSIVAQRT